jgi:carboxymethylenebutenolidase
MTSSTITLIAADGFQCAAYVSGPAQAPKGAIVVLQEIFGVNAHIRRVADRFAAAGYLAIAPSLFDRIERDVQMGYGPDDMKRGSALKAAAEAMPPPGVMPDIRAAVEHAAGYGKVGIVGYCWGGLLAWRAAEHIAELSAAVTYYGGGMTRGAELSRQPMVPVLSHFGDLDKHITADSVKDFEHRHPGVEVHHYAADHGFNCDERGAYDAGAAAAALERTLFHFDKYVAR